MKDIPGYEGLYAVTEDGRVWSHFNNMYMVLNPRNDYLRVGLRKDGKQKYFAVHRLVAAVYLGLDLSDRKSEVEHQSKIKSDNRKDNLIIVTHRQNCQARTSEILPEDTEIHKWCRKCREPKLKSMFNRNSRHIDGLGTTCRDCE